MPYFLYRRGNGNEGNSIRAMYEIPETIDLYKALRALVLNDYISGSYTRRYISANIEIDGEPEFGIMATVFEGPHRMTQFGAAWLTADLQLLTADEVAYYKDTTLPAYTLPEGLDRGARRILT